MKQVLPLAILLLSPLTTLAQAAVGLGKLTVPKAQIEILEGRLKVSVPRGSKVEPMQRGLMAAAAANSEETRVVIDAGDQRMVLMAYERFARSGGNLESEVQKQSTQFPVKVNLQKWPLSGQAQAIAYFPVAPRKDQGANFVMGLFVAGPDGLVRSLIWYVNPAGAAQFQAATNLAKTIAKTVTPGAKTLNVTPGKRELSIYSPTKSVYVSIPADYAVSTQVGPDFLVHHIRKIVAFGDPEASLGVYLGDHPSHTESGVITKATSIVFGKKVTWSQDSKSENGMKSRVARVLIPLGPRSEGASYADVFARASDEATLEELKTIATSLQIGNRETGK